MKEERKALTKEHIERQSKEMENLYQDYICVEDNNEDVVLGKRGDIQRFLKGSFDESFIIKRDMFWVPFDGNSKLS